MRQILCIALSLLLLLGGCAESAPAYTDVNLEEIRNYTKYYHVVEVPIERIVASEQEKLGWTSEFRELTDGEMRKKMGEELAARIGYMIASPLENEPEQPLWLSVWSEAVQSNPDMEFYFVQPLYVEQMLCFVLKGEDTPQAVYVKVGRNFAWYSFDDPQGFVELFWNQAEPVEY